tara:strand:+ start:4927 stop:5373 length:447 start_codon:yes stop_codon:yes gene_type:complete
LKLTPIIQRDAKEFINNYHRHHKAPTGDIYRVGLKKKNELIGVIMVGRPVNRNLDDGKTVEVLRCCIHGYHKNACSKLYSTAVKIAKNLGYEKIITYTLQKESGSSLKAVGFINEKKIKGRLWDTPKRPRKQISLFQEYDKIRWVKIL